MQYLSAEKRPDMATSERRREPRYLALRDTTKRDNFVINGHEKLVAQMNLFSIYIHQKISESG